MMMQAPERQDAPEKQDLADVAARLVAVQHRIEQAAIQAGRQARDIKLIAVSKRHSVAKIRAAFAAGQRDFGESYVQELLQKFDELRDLDGLRFHLIGHLQKNKARHAVRAAAWLHTVDSVALARELGKRLAQAGQAQLPVLVEVNIGAEPQKSGVLAALLPDVLDAIEREPKLRLSGLMTIPPQTADAGASLSYFRALAALREAHGGVQRLPELSMGMSDDLEYAVAAGSTFVRVGTAIFGERESAAELAADNNTLSDRSRMDP